MCDTSIDGSPSTIHSAISLADAAGPGDAVRAESGGDEEARRPPSRRGRTRCPGVNASGPLIIWRTPDLAHDRHAALRVGRDLLEARPVLGQQPAVEVGGHRVVAARRRRPRRGVALVAAHQQPVHLLPEVDEQVRVAQRRQRGLVAGPERFGDQVLVRHRDDRDADAGQPADLGGEHAAAVDHDLAGDVAAVGAHRAHPAGRRSLDADDPGVLGDAHAVRPGAGRERVAQLRRVEVAVGLEVGGARPRRRCRPAGTGRAASAGEISCSGRSYVRAQLICRRISSSRSGEDASLMPPLSVQPTGCSPSCSARYSSTEYMFIRVSVGSARSWPTSPAEWNVEPLVSSARSSTHYVAFAQLRQVVGHAGPADPAADHDDRAPTSGSAGARHGSMIARAAIRATRPKGLRSRPEPTTGPTIRNTITRVAAPVVVAADGRWR